MHIDFEPGDYVLIQQKDWGIGQVQSISNKVTVNFENFGKRVIDKNGNLKKLTMKQVN